MLATPNMQFWFPLLGDHNDHSGKGRTVSSDTGTLSGVDWTGTVSQEIQFSGPPASAFFTPGAITFSAWIKPDPSVFTSYEIQEKVFIFLASGDTGTCLSAIYGASDPDELIVGASVALSVDGDPNATLPVFTSGIVPLDGSWVHVLATLGPATSYYLDLYLNGRHASSTNTAYDDLFPTPQIGTWKIGGVPVETFGSTSMLGFPGKIRSVCAWSREVTAEDALRIYQDLHPLNG